MLAGDDLVRDHVPATCPPTCLGCGFCLGGLLGCSVCYCLEGCWTTDCPKRALTKEEHDDVYTGRKDFRDGQWLSEPGPWQQLWRAIGAAG